MTVNLNLAGLPAVCLPCGFVEQPGGVKLPVGMQVRCTRGVVWVCLWQLVSCLGPPAWTDAPSPAGNRPTQPPHTPACIPTLACCCCLQMIGRAFGEGELLQLAHVFEQTAGVMAGSRPAVYASEAQA
jgi:hypothetical protein